MKKNWLFALLCCVCAVAISCSDDDDNAADDNNNGGSSETAPTILVTATAGSDSFTVNLSVSSTASQFGYVASSTSLSVTAEQILAGSFSGVTSSGVYSATGSTTLSVDVAADEKTTYYIYAAAVTANGTYSAVATSTVTTLEGTPTETVSLHYASGYYYGDIYTTATDCVEYYIYFSDEDMSEDYVAGGHYYILSFRSTTEPTDFDSITLPAGTYTVGESDGNGVIYAGDSYYLVYGSSTAGFTTELSIASGSLTVSNSGSTTTVEGTLYDEEGTLHNFSYSGNMSIYDWSHYSTLTEDVTADLTGASAYAYYYGDTFGNGGAYWQVAVYNIPGEGFYLAYVGESSFDAEAGLPTGTYTGEYTANIGTYITGVLTSDGDESTLWYCWYFTATSDGYITSPYTPIGDGEITVTNNGDGTYTIKWDVYDDYDLYNVKAEWTGALTSLTDYSSSTSSLNVKSARPAANKFALPAVTPSVGKKALR